MHVQGPAPSRPPTIQLRDAPSLCDAAADPVGECFASSVEAEQRSTIAVEYHPVEGTEGPRGGCKHPHPVSSFPSRLHKGAPPFPITSSSKGDRTGRFVHSCVTHDLLRADYVRALPPFPTTSTSKGDRKGGFVHTFVTHGLLNASRKGWFVHICFTHDWLIIVNGELRKVRCNIKTPCINIVYEELRKARCNIETPVMRRICTASNDASTRRMQNGLRMRHGFRVIVVVDC